MNINAATSHNPILPIKVTNNAIPDQAVHTRDGSIKTGGTDNLSSLSPAIQQRIAALQSQAATSSDDATAGRFLTVDGLKAAWGESDSIYDLNGDGIVNVSDLLKLLAAGGTIAHDEAPLTIDGLLHVWGQSNAAYDLNGDGIVNVSDLLQLLAEQSGETAPAEAEALAPTSEAAIPGGATSVGSSFEKPASNPLPEDNPAAGIENTGKDPEVSDAQNPPVATSLHPFRSISELRDIAHAIFQRLLSAGYELKPPANIHSVVDQLQLSRSQKQAIIERLAERYPRGLGVNFVG